MKRCVIIGRLPNDRNYPASGSDFLSQVKQYKSLLTYPNVRVGLDPEWRLGPDEKPLTRVGQVEAAEVHQVVEYLANLVRDHKLPQKVLVLHQFQQQMLRDRDQIDLGREELAVAIHGDGQRTPPMKNDTCATLHEGACDQFFWGWKNFDDADQPMLTPAQSYQAQPTPDFVSYQ